MSILQKKIDFVALISVAMANPNGDPGYNNMPRTNSDGLGEISSVCIKRKIRNRMQDLGHPIFIQSPDHDGFDGCAHLKERATTALGDMDEATGDKACELWTDVRSFGQVFAISGKKANKESGEEGSSGVSIGLRGPVSIHCCTSVSPVQIESLSITKSVNGDDPGKGKSKSSDTMGMSHLVRYGLYVLKGSINVQLAEKAGFTTDDAELIKECLRTLFVNDASSARPDGSMEVVRLYWFEHNCKDGQYSAAKVHRSVHVEPKDPNRLPTCLDDYKIWHEELPDLHAEVIEGL